MKRRNLFMGAALMAVFFIFAFRFGKDRVQWFWTEQEGVPIILGIYAIIFGVWGFIENRKIKEKKR